MKTLSKFLFFSSVLSGFNATNASVTFLSNSKSAAISRHLDSFQKRVPSTLKKLNDSINNDSNAKYAFVQEVLSGQTDPHSVFYTLNLNGSQNEIFPMKNQTTIVFQFGQDDGVNVPEELKNTTIALVFKHFDFYDNTTGSFNGPKKLELSGAKCFIDTDILGFVPKYMGQNADNSEENKSKQLARLSGSAKGNAIFSNCKLADISITPPIDDSEKSDIVNFNGFTSASGTSFHEVVINEDGYKAPSPIVTSSPLLGTCAGFNAKFTSASAVLTNNTCIWDSGDSDNTFYTTNSTKLTSGTAACQAGDYGIDANSNSFSGILKTCISSDGLNFCNFNNTKNSPASWDSSLNSGVGGCSNVCESSATQGWLPSTSGGSTYSCKTVTNAADLNQYCPSGQTWKIVTSGSAAGSYKCQN